MPLTYSFKETIVANIRSRPGLRNEMMIGAVEELLAGDVAVAKSVLRDVVNGTMGFETLGKKVGIPAKSLMRMLGPNGNPQAKNLFAVIVVLQEEFGISLEVTAKRRARPKSVPRVAKKCLPGRLRRAEALAVPGFSEKKSRFKRR